MCVRGGLLGCFVDAVICFVRIRTRWLRRRLFTTHKISTFYETNLEEHLEGYESIACGILTNRCVRSLVNDAYDRDFVITDCCTAFDEDTLESTIRDLKATRDELVFTDTDSFIEGI